MCSFIHLSDYVTLFVTFLGFWAFAEWPPIRMVVNIIGQRLPVGIMMSLIPGDSRDCKIWRPNSKTANEMELKFGWWTHYKTWQIWWTFEFWSSFTEFCHFLAFDLSIQQFLLIEQFLLISKLLFRQNYTNPVYDVATICHQVRWLRWGHPSLFHTATSLLIWYKMFCVRDISYRLIWMEFLNMFSVYAQSGTHSRFNW